ncbi:putative pentatricopeptide repeat-containing protein-like [Capsicum annuum]|uniref:uncharacterized protein LOC107860251 n=1 Tax=Capsicum annuum TaxID=4072 RepID=UPI0007BEAB4F|nr:uncharacterized protein LOC107860251 [Capsicum annuum]KAF3624783.1 putative pentatricopeptide repeat-containing protein-like [Capsicum annuum]
MEEKAGDFRVPLISSFFCLCVLTGGVLLVLYIFVPNYSTPWFPAVGLLLVGSPYIFWLLTYIYTCLKRCCFGDRIDNRQISRRASRAPTMAKSGVARTDSRANSAISNNNNDDNQAGGHSHQNEGDASSSINSTKESEMPLAVSVAP